MLWYDNGIKMAEEFISISILFTGISQFSQENGQGREMLAIYKKKKKVCTTVWENFTSPDMLVTTVKRENILANNKSSFSFSENAVVACARKDTLD